MAAAASGFDERSIVSGCAGAGWFVPVDDLRRAGLHAPRFSTPSPTANWSQGWRGARDMAEHGQSL